MLSNHLYVKAAISKLCRIGYLPLIFHAQKITSEFELNPILQFIDLASRGHYGPYTCFVADIFPGVSVAPRKDFFVKRAYVLSSGCYCALNLSLVGCFLDSFSYLFGGFLVSWSFFREPFHRESNSTIQSSQLASADRLRLLIGNS